MTERTTRRTYLERAAASAGLAAIAGCVGGDGANGDGTGGNGAGNESEDDDGGTNGTGEEDDAPLPAFPEIEDPPDAVYLPTHRESMRLLDPVRAGEYVVEPMLSYPHPFWTVAGGEIEREEPEDGTGVHLMFAVRDAETGVALPVEAGAQLRVRNGGEDVESPRVPWPMLSQEMGFHFGDNVPLPEDGTYVAEVTLPPLSVRLTGDLAGKFGGTATATFEFEYDDAFREEVVGGVEYLDEAEWGEPGALEPMGGDDASESALAPAASYPGTRLEPANPAEDGLAESGDARFVATLLEPGSRFVDGDERYLLVSPRTPYNRFPIPNVSLDATLEREGETIADSGLAQTIDGEYGLHYGTALADVEPGDTATIEIPSIPQVARHRGYETAFVAMDPIELTVPARED